MLTFNQAIKIFQSYSELNEKVSGNRHRFQVPQSLQRGKELAREIKCNQDGSYNGYINAKYMPANIKQKYAHITDSRQMISIKGLTALQLRQYKTELHL
ncbi:hypothetical protein [Psychrobacillus antarcticus]|uniref:hypothetical protein n=1 Tax=Psychrobacillus antarcticus TaxID=2879115 RepID=UPI0024086AED|nr:hypothetical protein [Psychrobacillus antarcticus]